MLGHRTGMIGFPLRLLARENYDRVAALKGTRARRPHHRRRKNRPAQSALFRLHRRIDAARPARSISWPSTRFSSAPIPSAAMSSPTACFTRAARDETMLLGADTIRPLLKRLVPEAEYVSRPRFSTLSYAGAKKISRLPPRSAVVAFAVADVFRARRADAPPARRHGGGAGRVVARARATPRSALFQSGEVDYMVATDAIGMGLNMDFDHVAFARHVKFDGRARGGSSAPEIAQIAGRAGRHMNDGTFGITADELDALDARDGRGDRESPVRSAGAALLAQRASSISGSVGALLKSLDARPHLPGTDRDPRRRRSPGARRAGERRRDRAAARDPDAVRLLWEVCQIPDFRKVVERHPCAVAGADLSPSRGRSERLPVDWVAAQVSAARPRRRRHRHADGRASRISAPGPISRIGRTGWPTRRRGRSAHARSRIISPTRCTTASRSVSSIAARPFSSSSSHPRASCSLR